MLIVLWSIWGELWAFVSVNQSINQSLFIEGQPPNSYTTNKFVALIIKPVLFLVLKG